MFLYNLTLIVEDNSAEELLLFIKDKLIPKALETDLFTDHKILKVVDSPNEGQTFCLQLFTKSNNEYITYVEKFSLALEGALDLQFKNRYVPYRTLMEHI